jgi:hypothetical protein
MWTLIVLSLITPHGGCPIACFREPVSSEACRTACDAAIGQHRSMMGIYSTEEACRKARDGLIGSGLPVEMKGTTIYCEKK